MGDQATEENKQNEKTLRDDLPDLSGVSLALRRFIHLGCSVGPYHSKRYHIRGIAPLQPYSHDQILALGVFSELLDKDGDRTAIEKDKSQNGPSSNTIEVIRKVMKENEGTSRRAALFILAACCRTKSYTLNDAYTFVKDIKCADDLLIFIKYAMDLAPKKTGWGSGLRRALKSWYFERGDMELAEQLTCVRQRFCWSHKDILKLLHAKPRNKVQELVIAYAMHGIGKAKEILKNVTGEDPIREDAEKMFAYLNAANELRKLRTPRGCNSKTPEVQKAVNLIKTHKFQLEHCDDTMHLEPLVWEALLEHMPFWKVLEHLPKLRCNRILKPGEDLNKAILISLRHLHDTLTKASSSLTSPISPGVVLVSMQTYRRVNNEDVPSKVWVSTKDGVVAVRNPHGKHGPPNLTAAHNQTRTAKSQGSADAITAGMVENLSSAFQAMKPTGKHFIFATGKTQQKNGCLVNLHVMTHEAAALLFICLDAVETHGNVAGYCIDSNSTSVAKLRSPGCSISSCSREITQETASTPINVECWLGYLSRQKLATDVIVLVAESFVSERDSGQRLLEAMKKYRMDTKKPTAKLVMVSFASKVLPQIEAEKFDYGILMVYGFDSQLPFIIQRFARGDF
ncbi:hypothetical protein J437_LFUL003498 [Ladona fulva]|uniref:TROVE domain-containing protein n=1 Tax=Ladona fulva TaxID=123851 RepID=A0A8K0JYY1_LADFU|nr:hypothetical protein J437_LFUL003498 [Ladona fulva]